MARARSLLLVAAALAAGTVNGARLPAGTGRGRPKESIDDVLRRARENRGRKGWFQPEVRR